MDAFDVFTSFRSERIWVTRFPTFQRKRHHKVSRCGSLSTGQPVSTFGKVGFDLNRLLRRVIGDDVTATYVVSVYLEARIDQNVRQGVESHAHNGPEDERRSVRH